MELMIRPEFRDKIPPLTQEEFERLESNIVEDGVVLQPIITWNGYIVDGHNRWEIIKKHPDIPYTTKEMHFDNQEQAEVWICTHQLGRRNLNAAQRTYLIGMAYSASKKVHGGWRGNRYEKLASYQNDNLLKARERLAKDVGVGAATVSRAEKFSKAVDDIDTVSPGFKSSILSGKVTMTQKDILDVSSLPEEEKKKVSSEILSSGKAARNVYRRTKENREIEKVVSASVDSMYEAECETSVTLEDICSSVDSLVEGFASSVKCLFCENIDFFLEDSGKEAFRRCLSKIDAVATELKGMVT